MLRALLCRSAGEHMVVALDSEYVHGGVLRGVRMLCTKFVLDCTQAA